MALTLHKVMSDGGVVHEEFSKSSWERALRDPQVRHRWAHRPDDCHNPVERLRDEIAKRQPSAAVELREMGMDRGSPGFVLEELKFGKKPSVAPPPTSKRPTVPAPVQGSLF